MWQRNQTTWPANCKAKGRQSVTWLVLPRLSRQNWFCFANKWRKDDPSTLLYPCESAFSDMNFIKPQFRTHWCPLGWLHQSEPLGIHTRLLSPGRQHAVSEISLKAKHIITLKYANIHCKNKTKIRGVDVACDLFYFLKVALILKKVGDPCSSLTLPIVFKL